MFERVSPEENKVEILPVRRSRKQEILLVLKKGQDLTSFSSALTTALAGKADVATAVSMRWIEIVDLDETVVVAKVLEVVRGLLGKPELDVPCQLVRRYGGTQMAILRLPDLDAESLLKTGRVKIGWVNCRGRARVEVDRCFKCLCYGHLARGCSGPDRRNACWNCGDLNHKSKSCKSSARCMTFSDKGSKEVNHLPGSRACPVY